MIAVSAARAVSEKWSFASLCCESVPSAIILGALKVPCDSSLNVLSV